MCTYYKKQLPKWIAHTHTHTHISLCLFSSFLQAFQAPQDYTNTLRCAELLIFFICIQSRGTDRTSEQHTAGSKDSAHQHTAHTMRTGCNKEGTSEASITWTVCVCVRESCERSYCHSAGPLRSIQINSNKKTVGGGNLQSFLVKEERSTTWTLSQTLHLN